MRFITVMFGIVFTVAGQTPRVTRAVGGFLGVGVQEIDSERAKALKLNQELGVEVTRIEPGSPAERAGLTDGDVVVDFHQLTCHRGGAELNLTAREFRMLEVMAAADGRPVGREEFLDKVWEYSAYPTTRTAKPLRATGWY